MTMTVGLQAGEDEFGAVARQMSKWIEQMVGPEYRRYLPGESWAPAVNLYEDDHAFYVVVDLAGVDADAVNLRVESGRLILSGQRDTPRPDKSSGRHSTHLMEIDTGPFLRSVEVPSSVDVDGIVAKYRTGLLRITLPKKPAP